jgi:hypothetical protein
MITVEDVLNQLESRAYNHGMDVADLVEKIPLNVVDSPSEVNEWLSQKDVSHIYPQSTHPWMASDPSNVMWEDSLPNQIRGAEVMTEAEVLTAELDNTFDADIIDSTFVDDNNEEWLEVLEMIDPDIFVSVL